MSLLSLSALLGLTSLSFAVPVPGGPIPGESSYFSTYRGKSDAFPANTTKAPINPTVVGPPGHDDLLFQNLLSAEWVIYSFYQQGVELFNTSDFVDAGYPNTTWDRIAEIRDNEAGHLAIFQAQISAASVTPGACEYRFPFTDIESYLYLQTVIELSSMAFLTGLVLEAEDNVSKAALVAIGETETRHNTWSLIDVWNTNPFAGPADTIFPYANEILDITNEWVVPGSCPVDNPPYPEPNQRLPRMSSSNSTTGVPGSHITFIYPDASRQPTFDANRTYYSVAFHGVHNFSTPYDTTTQSAMVPASIEAGKGLTIFVIADEAGAPSLESVVAGPLILPSQPTLT